MARLILILFLVAFCAAAYFAYKSEPGEPFEIPRPVPAKSRL